MGRRLLKSAAFLILAAQAGIADQVSLLDGGRLSGEVVSMSSEGSLILDSTLAAAALEIRPEQIRRVDFKQASGRLADHDARLLLVNDDILPCDLLGIDEKQIQVRTSFAGELTIPRQVVKRLQLGIRPHRPIVSGIGDSGKWFITNKDWSVNGNELVSSGSGIAGQDVPQLGDSFSLSFLLKWQQRPTFKVFFCSDPEKGSGGELDRYYLQFNAEGLELKRQSSGRTSYHGLGVINRTPDTFSNRQVRIEFRVDRRARMILLYLDGELEGRFPDQLETAPQANGFVFESSTQAAAAHSVSEFEIREWDASGDRHQSEDRGDETTDAVIDHDGQRFSGSLLATARNDERAVVLFQSPHLDQPLTIPTDRISTIFLANPAAGPDPSELYFGLGGNGRISASNGRFDQTQIQLDHPLLGKLTLDRSAAASLERREPPADDPPDEP